MSSVRVDPIASQADAQKYGSNVHSLIAARDERERRAWDEKLTMFENGEDPCGRDPNICLVWQNCGCFDRDPDGGTAA